MKSQIVDVEVHLHHQTERAFLISLNGDRDRAVWVPKSLVEMERSDRSESIWIMTGPEPFLTDKGLT